MAFSESFFDDENICDFKIWSKNIEGSLMPDSEIIFSCTMIKKTEKSFENRFFYLTRDNYLYYKEVHFFIKKK